MRTDVQGAPTHVVVGTAVFHKDLAGGAAFRPFRQHCGIHYNRGIRLRRRHTGSSEHEPRRADIPVKVKDLVLAVCSAYAVYMIVPEHIVRAGRIGIIKIQILARTHEMIADDKIGALLVGVSEIYILATVEFVFLAVVSHAYVVYAGADEIEFAVVAELDTEALRLYGIVAA